MLGIILSHWAIYFYVTYVLILAIVVIVKRKQPVDTAWRPPRPWVRPMVPNWRARKAG